MVWPSVTTQDNHGVSLALLPVLACPLTVIQEWGPTSTSLMELDSPSPSKKPRLPDASPPPRSDAAPRGEIGPNLQGETYIDLQKLYNARAQEVNDSCSYFPSILGSRVPESLVLQKKGPPSLSGASSSFASENHVSQPPSHSQTTSRKGNYFGICPSSLSKALHEIEKSGDPPSKKKKRSYRVQKRRVNRLERNFGKRQLDKESAFLSVDDSFDFTDI